MPPQLVIETSTGWNVRCPACGWHEFPKQALANGSRWTFNGDVFRPTFSPSMNQSFKPTLPTHPERRCHFIITDGKIQFCSDCTHGYAGRTVDMIPYSDAEVAMAKADMSRPEDDKAK